MFFLSFLQLVTVFTGAPGVLIHRAHNVPVVGPLGAPILRPHNHAVEAQNKDLLAPPLTDHGAMPNIKWPFSLSHNRLVDGGWARQQTGTVE